MPNAEGRFKGILVPELPWLKHLSPEERDVAENDRLLASDQAIYGTFFQDVTGKRIDPTTVKPSGESSTARSAKRT